MLVALILFALAAVGGIVLASLRMRNQPLPMPVSIGHGLLAAAGLVALIAEAVAGSISGPVTIALGLFVAAALGGFVLFGLHLRGRVLPMGFVAGHGVLAVVAFILLLWGYLAG